jgi:drug/metabolite transporter (DMT)-like permease
MKRAVRTLIRLVAAGLAVVGVMVLGLEFIRLRGPSGRIDLWNGIVGLILVVLAVVLFAASSALAKRWTEDFEE